MLLASYNYQNSLLIDFHLHPIYIIHENLCSLDDIMYPLTIFLSFLVSSALFAFLHISQKSTARIKLWVAASFIILTMCMALGRGFFNSITIFSIYLGTCLSLLVFHKIISKRQTREFEELEKKEEENQYKIKYKG